MSSLITFLADNGNELVFILCGLLGGTAHYLKKFVRKETAVPIWDWFGKANLAATMYTFLVFLFAMIGSIASGVVNDSMSVWIAMYVGFVTGFALDAGFNSDGNRNSVVNQLNNGGGQGGIFGGRSGVGGPGLPGDRQGGDRFSERDDDPRLPRVDPNRCPPMPDVKPPRKTSLTDLRPEK